MRRAAVLLTTMALLAPLANGAVPQAATTGPLEEARALVDALAAVRDEPSVAAAYDYARGLQGLPAEPADVPPLDLPRHLASLAPGVDLSFLAALPIEALDALANVVAVHVATAAALRDGASLHELEALRATLVARIDALAELRTMLATSMPAPIDVCGALYLYLGNDPQVVGPCEHPLSIGGFGDDTYLDRAGGAYQGAALAIELGGNDRYVANLTDHGGINGGAFQGAGALVDLAGDDVYDASAFTRRPNGDPAWPIASINGGARYGTGLLVDLAGTDAYDGKAGMGGINGGASFAGSGALIDLGGTGERFHGHVNGLSGGVNGGANDGLGLFFHCGSGTNAYTGWLLERGGVNGGGEQAIGVTVSCGGTSALYDGRTGGGGVNAGASGDALGVLVHLEGDALFRGTAVYGGINGGAYLGEGLLVTGAGDHTYDGKLDRVGGINGGAVSGAGQLVDLGAGDDTYLASGPGTLGVNGGAFHLATGVLLDDGGDDTYDAWVGGDQAFELDYIAVQFAGGAANGHGSLGACGLLLDLGGHDHYRDDPSSPWDHDSSRQGTPPDCGARVDG